MLKRWLRQFLRDASLQTLNLDGSRVERIDAKRAQIRGSVYLRHEQGGDELAALLSGEGDPSSPDPGGPKADWRAPVLVDARGIDTQAAQGGNQGRDRSLLHSVCPCQQKLAFAQGSYRQEEAERGPGIAQKDPFPNTPSTDPWTLSFHHQTASGPGYGNTELAQGIDGVACVFAVQVIVDHTGAPCQACCNDGPVCDAL